MNPERVVDGTRRVALWATSMVIALLALALAMLPTDDSTPWQVLLTIVTLVFLGTCPWFPPGLAVAAAAATVVAALALVDTDFPAVSLIATGVLALGAFDLMALMRMWQSVGRVDLDAERGHLVAIAHRCGLGGIVAAGAMAIGAIELPSPGIVAALGVVAAGVVIVLSASRSA